MEWIEPLTAIALAGCGGICWLIVALVNHTRRAAKYHADIAGRLKRLEEWRIAHQQETEDYQNVLQEVRIELAYSRGRRESGGDGD